jgi:N-methylhydantoinase A
MNRVGVDIGGTHTDLVVLDNGAVRLHKVASNEADPSAAVRRGLSELRLNLHETEVFAHGTTVAINSVIQRCGAIAGLITTKGFRDVLQIRRTTRGELYDFQWHPPPELVPRRWRREVSERTAADGTVQCEVDLDVVVAQARELVAEGVTSIAVAFINSYRNPSNELAVKKRLQAEFPNFPVYLSAELLPAWREFERTSTAVVGAYVGPTLTEYLRSIEGFLRRDGYRFDLLVMQSNGGLGTAHSAIENPVSTLMSGPAAGVIAEIAISRMEGIANLIGMDIGGTSTDVSVVLDGTPLMRSEFDIEFGTVVGFPMIDINSIGAGGGTIAWLDNGGLLHVGPKSAGAMPGPACYGKGGAEPTLTDAYVATGRLNPTALLGGTMKIDAKLARSTVKALGTRCGLELERMAAGIVALIASNISSTVRQMTVERGLNPRELTLVAYGGGGPTLACDVAQDLEILTILVPRYPGLTSAFGLLLTDIRHDYTRTFLNRNDEVSADAVASEFDRLVGQGNAKLAAEDIPVARRRFELAADLRFIGQTHELTIPLGTKYGREIHATLGEKLRVQHLAQFGHAPDGNQPVEIVCLRMAAFGSLDRPSLGSAKVKVDPVPEWHRKLYAAREWRDVPVFLRDNLGRNATLTGPAIIEQLDSTTVVLEGWKTLVLGSGSLLLTRRQ